MAGWVKLHRKMLEWEWYDDHNTFRLFMTLLMMANHADKKWRGNLIMRGSLLTSLDSLSVTTGLSVQQIRTALDKLILTGEITNKSTSKNRIITISKWDSYQNDNNQDNSEVTNEQQAGNKQVTTNKNEKNVEKVKNKDISTEPIIGSIPTNRTDEVFDITESFANEMQNLYPAVNVRQEINKMIGWAKTNQSKRKTFGGMPKFINSWLAKEQDKGGSNGQAIRGVQGLSGAAKRAADFHENLKLYSEGGAAAVMDRKNFR